MAIEKVINGKLVTIADKSITDHSQLTGNQAYGCHPISAIRKLPEKLQALKEADEKLAEDMDVKIASAERLANIVLEKTEELDEVLDIANNTVSQIQTDINKINLKVEGSTVSFTNVNDETQSFRVGSDVDNDTISINDNEQLTLKKVYINEDEIIGNGNAESPLQLKNKLDNKTIAINNNSQVYVKAIQGNTDDEIISYQTITNKNIENQNKFIAIQKQFEDTAEDVKEEFDRVNDKITEVITDQEVINITRLNQINDLYTRTQGLGGYLNAYDFGVNPTQDALTQYAIQDTGVLRPEDIFNGTKVKNLYNDHIWILTNTQDSDPVVFSWEDHGKDTYISDANNDGIHGLMTGSYEHLEGFIDTLGHVTINGLQEELNNIKTNATNLSQELNEKVDNGDNSLSEQLESEVQRATTAETDIIENYATKVELKDAFYSRATNIIASPEEDTVENWCTLGGGVYWFNGANCLISQPSQYGFLMNIPQTEPSGDVTQLFFSQRDGSIYHRGGNPDGWGNNGQWRMLVESANNSYHTIPHDLTINGTLYIN